MICAAPVLLSGMGTKAKQAERPVQVMRGLETTLLVGMCHFCGRLLLLGLLSVVAWSMEALMR